MNEKNMKKSTTTIIKPHPYTKLLTGIVSQDEHCF